MISNQKYAPLIAEALEELAEQGLEILCPALEKLFMDLKIKCCKQESENSN